MRVLNNIRKTGSEDRTSHNDLTSDVTVGSSPLDEYRKSLNLLADAFSDLPQTGSLDIELIASNTTGSETFGENQNIENDIIHSPNTACEILAHLSQGGVGDYPQNDMIQDIVKDTNIDWSAASSEALLQLVHTDHPYLSQEADDRQQPPAQSTSCSSIPDAELIHDFFLHTTNMIAYQPIAESGNQPIPNTATTLIGCPQPYSRAHLVPSVTPITEISDDIKDATTSDEVMTLYNLDSRHLVKKDIEHTSQVSKQSQAENVNRCGNEDSRFDKGSKSAHETNEGRRQSKHSSSEITDTGDKTIHHMETSTSTRLRDVDVDDTPQDKVGTLRKHKGEHLKEEKASQIQKKTSLTSEHPQKEDMLQDPHRTCNDETQPSEVSNMASKERSTQSQECDTLTNMVQAPSLNQWTAACKAVTEKAQEESLLNCAINLMLKVWADYLSLTFDEVRQREIETARELNYCDDVIEMLEDKDRYVWQIIEEMEPRNFSMDL